MRVCKSFSKPSLTKQSYKEECDVNVIMARFKKVAGEEFLNRYQGYLNGSFGDFSEVADYRSAIEQIREAEGVFDALPSKVRARFANDPAEFLDFVHNPANRDELVAMGLMEAPVSAPAELAPGVTRGKAKGVDQGKVDDLP